MKKIKWENVIFILLMIAYLINDLSINNNLMLTIAGQLYVTLTLRFTIKYIRVNFKSVKAEIKTVFCD